MKIVALLPAATEIVCALGLRDQLVGRSHECDFPAGVEQLPALTRARVDAHLPSDALDAEVRRVLAERLPLYELDSAWLERLQPDVVVTQEACEVCAVAYDQVVGALAGTCPATRVVSLRPTHLDDVLADVRSVAQACGVAAQGEHVAGALARRLQSLAERPWSGPRPRVAIVEWLAPPMLAGHWAPELLVTAGAQALGPRPGEPSPYTSWDELRRLAPDALVVAPCGFDLERTRQEAARYAHELRRVSPRVLLMDGNAYVNRPGPRLVEAAEIVAAFLRDESLDARDAQRLD
jgi:iron complex transport system substrate-binding protein